MSHTGQWSVRLHLFEDDAGTTKAHITLDTGTTTLTGSGTAHCNPSDTTVPEIGDELAAGRAMHDLAHQLLDVAGRDVQGMAASRPGIPRAAVRPA
ncbi:dsRBD fold-containing protein [Streptomyces sp. NPDC012751]|uniref:dsRBD fold-containing protein n=1 Tax=Streptomyces sp. NPDC012751 TaxID=3364846 RepID=UPI003688FAA0